MRNLVFCAITIVFFAACARNRPAERPNIVLIMSDDVGYSDIGCYGGEINTPNLDRLAANGLRFTQFYNTSRCCPTRGSLLTGLYPHQAGIGHMMNDRGNEAYQGDLSINAVTIAEVLGTAGYATYMAGKWHVTPYLPESPDPPRHNWPLQRGFQRFFGTILGAGSFYDPASLTSGNAYIPPPEDFYYTDAISDTTARYIREHDTEDPFFIYVAYTAAHWPMHALPDDIAKYKGRYSEGWSALREDRYRRMLEMGLIEPEWHMSAAYPGEDWDAQEDKAFHERCMEVYAAMLDNMDRGIGRIVQSLDEAGKLDNTIILYLQDNGACAESFGFYRSEEELPEDLPIRPMAPNAIQTKMVPDYTRDGSPVRVAFGVMPGPADTYVGYAEDWANASNTPYRMFKHWSHEGGISTPLIVHWPAGIEQRGAFRNTPGHLIDIMATCVDVAGAEYPSVYNGSPVQPLEGMSLVPVFEKDTLERAALYWEHEGNRAIRLGKWKLVNKAYQWPLQLDTLNRLPLDMWELYDMEADRTESMNLAEVFPERVQEMASLWQAWAGRSGAVPKPPGTRRASRHYEHPVPVTN